MVALFGMNRGIVLLIMLLVQRHYAPKSTIRAVLYPDGAEAGDARSWEAAFDETLARAIGELGDAVAR